MPLKQTAANKKMYIRDIFLSLAYSFHSFISSYRVEINIIYITHTHKKEEEDKKKKRKKKKKKQWVRIFKFGNIGSYFFVRG